MDDTSGETHVFDRHHQIREGLYHPDLTRKHDERTFEEGNARADILSMLHADEHRGRRRLENPLFRREALVAYERELFPQVLRDILSTQQEREADLFPLAGALAVVLAARRAGIDHGGTMAELLALWDHVLMIAQASAILDVVGDPDQVMQDVCDVLRIVDRDHVTPSRQRREQLIAAGVEVDGAEIPDDLITRVLTHRSDGSPLVEGMDDGVLAREVALYLHGGSHTSAQTTCNTFFYLLGLDGPGVVHPALERVAADPLWAQAAVHETLRLRPTTPRLQRRATQPLVLDGVRIGAGAAVVFDVRAANRDPELFGDDADTFDPGRRLPDGVPLWGNSFGAGPHVCIGRSVAGGFPIQDGDVHSGVGDAHLYGLVALIVRAIASCDPRSVVTDPPELDRRTDRGTRWARFPLELARTPASVTHGA
jgi:cytochrome P450